jgi:hypothetical protein
MSVASRHGAFRRASVGLEIGADHSEFRLQVAYLYSDHLQSTKPLTDPALTPKLMGPPSLASGQAMARDRFLVVDRSRHDV